MDKLTSKFQMALAEAQSLAVGQDHQFIEPVHLMVALLDQQGSSIRGLLTKSGTNVNLLRSQLGVALDRLPKVEGTGGDVHISNDLNKLLNLTDKLAQKRNDQYISSELFVLAALDDKSPLAPILQQAGAVRGAVEKSVDELRGGQNVDDPNAEDTRQALEKYTIDLVPLIPLQPFALPVAIAALVSLEIAFLARRDLTTFARGRRGAAPGTKQVPRLDSVSAR
jgi:ATP-dependent Clp protease ATP-binding subunit ClpB